MAYCNLIKIMMQKFSRYMFPFSSLTSCITKEYFSKVPSFYPESSVDLKQHIVFLNDIQNEVVVLGFEDTPRNVSDNYNDFKYAVFYITFLFNVSILIIPNLTFFIFIFH